MWRILVAFLGIALGVAVGQKPAPRFEDYPAIGAYLGKNAPVAINSADDRRYRTMLRGAATEKPNFAGHYIVAEWGCGAGCVMGAVIDANSGKVHWLPHTICCWPEDVHEPVDFRLASRLIVLIGERDEKEGDDGTHYYEFKDGKFVYLHSVKREKH